MGNEKINDIPSDIRAQFDGVSEDVLANFAEQLSSLGGNEVTQDKSVGERDTEKNPETGLSVNNLETGEDEDNDDSAGNDGYDSEQQEQEIDNGDNDSNDTTAGNDVTGAAGTGEQQKPKSTDSDLSAALKQERAKTKKLRDKDAQRKKEFDDLKNEIAQMRQLMQQGGGVQQRPFQQQQQTVSQPEAQQQQQAQQQGVPTKNTVVEYRQKLIEESRAAFKRDYDREPDIYNNEEDAFIFNAIQNEIHNENVDRYNRQKTEQERQAKALQTAGQRYASFVNQITADPDYNNIIALAQQNVAKMDPAEQTAINDSLSRLVNGKPNMTDVVLVKNLWDVTEKAYKAANPPTTEEDDGAGEEEETTKKVQQTAQQKVAAQQKKINQMNSHTRASQVNNSNAGAGQKKWTYDKVQQIINQPGGYDQLLKEAPHVLAAIQEGRPF